MVVDDGVDGGGEGVVAQVGAVGDLVIGEARGAGHRHGPEVGGLGQDGCVQVGEHRGERVVAPEVWSRCLENPHSPSTAIKTSANSTTWGNTLSTRCLS